MNKLKSIKDGTRDYIYDECKLKRLIIDKLSKIFSQNGYSEIMTPTIEFCDIFDIKNYVNYEDIYKFTDEKNRLLALRADCTMPIARVVATKFNDIPNPFRLYYAQNVINTSNVKLETTQTGVELIGIKDIRADIEVLWLSIFALKEFFDGKFHIELGHGQLFNILIDEYKIEQQIAEEARTYIENKNFAALASLNIPDEIKELPKMFGKIEVLDAYINSSKIPKIIEILQYLKEIYNLLVSLNLEQYITFDLGLVHKLDYYTGIIFKGYVEGSGRTILSGGRYDSLIENFGKDLDAIGFGIDVDQIFDVLQKQHKINIQEIDALIYFSLEKCSEAYNLLIELTQKGKVVILSTAKNKNDAINEAKNQNIKNVYIFDQNFERIEL